MCSLEDLKQKIRVIQRITQCLCYRLLKAILKGQKDIKILVYFNRSGSRKSSLEKQ